MGQRATACEDIFMRAATHLSLVLLACAQLALNAGPAPAQTRTIKIIVPSTPGGGSDTIARILADYVSRAYNQSMVVENRPGASNTIGTEAVARSAPDGNTLVITTPEFVINAHLRKLSYDPLTSFEPICNLVQSPQLIVVNATSPYRTLKDLLDAARTKPGELTMASAGPASSPHIAIETIKRATGVNINYIPYQGTTPAVNALMGDHLTSVMSSYPNVSELIRTGRLRALATTTAKRIQSMPDLPTVAEAAGIKDFDVDIWFGVNAAAKTPRELTAQLAAWFTAALKMPEVKAKLDVQGLFEVGTCGEDYAAFLRKQYDDYGRAIRDANIKVQ
jgi:tripartite-type tricarboxylate transporter receptor subunit TctC